MFKFNRRFSHKLRFITVPLLLGLWRRVLPFFSFLRFLCSLRICSRQSGFLRSTFLWFSLVSLIFQYPRCSCPTVHCYWRIFKFCCYLWISFFCGSSLLKSNRCTSTSLIFLCLLFSLCFEGSDVFEFCFIESHHDQFFQSTFGYYSPECFPWKWSQFWRNHFLSLSFPSRQRCSLWPNCAELPFLSSSFSRALSQFEGLWWRFFSTPKRTLRQSKRKWKTKRLNKRKGKGKLCLSLFPCFRFSEQKSWKTQTLSLHCNSKRKTNCLLTFCRVGTAKCKRTWIRTESQKYMKCEQAATKELFPSKDNISENKSDEERKSSLWTTERKNPVIKDRWRISQSSPQALGHKPQR